MTPYERIKAAHTEFLSWDAPSELEPWQRDLMTSDRRSCALARLVGTLASLARHGDVSEEDLAEAVEVSLRVANVDLTFGRTREPKPLPDVPGPFPVSADREARRSRGWLVDA